MATIEGIAEITTNQVSTPDLGIQGAPEAEWSSQKGPREQTPPTEGEKKQLRDDASPNWHSLLEEEKSELGTEGHQMIKPETARDNNKEKEQEVQDGSKLADKVVEEENLGKN